MFTHTHTITHTHNTHVHTYALTRDDIGEHRVRSVHASRDSGHVQNYGQRRSRLLCRAYACGFVSVCLLSVYVSVTHTHMYNSVYMCGLLYIRTDTKCTLTCGFSTCVFVHTHEYISPIDDTTLSFWDRCHRPFPPSPHRLTDWPGLAGWLAGVARSCPMDNM